jgi:hypothetical protein
MKRLLPVVLLLAVFSSTARADAISQTASLPGGSLTVAIYSGYGQTKWDAAYLFPQFIDRNGLWQATMVVFDMPSAGGFFDLKTSDNQLFASVYGNGIGLLWSFDATSLPNNPILFNFDNLPQGGGNPSVEVSLAVLDPPSDPPRIIPEPYTVFLFVPGLLALAIFSANRLRTPKSKLTAL